MNVLSKTFIGVTLRLSGLFRRFECTRFGDRSELGKFVEVVPW
jgi:hypothetical protein